MSRFTRQQSAKIILSVANRLSEALSELDTPVDVAAIAIDLETDNDCFNAWIGRDDEIEDGASILVTPVIISHLYCSLKKCGLLVFDGGYDSLAENPEQEPFLVYCLEWILLHEIAHWLRGHVSYLCAKREARDTPVWLASVENTSVKKSTYSGELSELQGRDEPEAEIYRYFELQADELATQLLAIIHDNDEAITIPGNWTNTRKYLPISSQMAGLVAGIVILIMQQLRGTLGDPEEDRHPSPDTRAFCTIVALLGHAMVPHGRTLGREVRLRSNNGDEIEKIRAILSDALMIFVFDLTAAAKRLSVQPVFHDNKPANIDFGDFAETAQLSTHTLRDLLLWIMAVDTAPDEYLTSGAREASTLVKSADKFLDSIRDHVKWPM